LSEVFDMSFLKNVKPIIAKMREEMIWSNEGRIYLVASADAYGYEVDRENNILLKDGSKMTPKHADYDAIIKSAKKDARNSPIWGDF
tara:strand:- start:505 stop:765 length:261 start_codon:yes stop_codon:yes gene_type:complete